MKGTLSVFLRAASGAAVLLCLAWAPADATIMREMSVDELSILSSHVVRGTVLGQVSKWSDDGKGIHTYVDVAILEQVKGTRLLPEVVQILVPGGELDGKRMAIVGGPTFRPGEDLFLFLAPYSDNPAEADLVVLIGGKQGRLPVITDPEGGEPRVLRQFGGLEFARLVQDPADEEGRPRTEITAAPPDRLMPISEFRRQVLAATRPGGTPGKKENAPGRGVKP